jgi:hypothetical protein
MLICRKIIRVDPESLRDGIKKVTSLRDSTKILSFFGGLTSAATKLPSLTGLSTLNSYNHTLNIPVAWLLDDDFEEMIIGREIVFDMFDIEFKQAVEEIIFKKRDDYVS